MDCESTTFAENNLEIADINNIIYPVTPGEQIYVAITNNVSSADEPRSLTTAYDHDERLLGPSVMDQFDYVMFGKAHPYGRHDGVACGPGSSVRNNPSG
ncbi:unnamed protein product [Durusdinium trenchii]|uniref:Uncharacterized protein n=2 Tax=Durusdinium trenchii TaxID=1381693 RepID=A0ABP0NU11_9DINO